MYLSLPRSLSLFLSRTCLLFIQPQTLVEAGSRINFESIQKISLLLVTVALTCYSAVSPRNLALPQYNLRFYENVRIVSLAMIAPAINILAVFDPRENDINSVIHTFFTSFTIGYLLAFAIELLVTTAIRLGVFQWFEPNIFSLSPIVSLFPFCRGSCVRTSTDRNALRYLWPIFVPVALRLPLSRNTSN